MTFHIGKLYFRHAVISKKKKKRKKGYFRRLTVFTNPKVQKEAATVIMDSILIRPFWKSCLLEQKQLA